MMNLASLLTPRRIAVIGASVDRQKLGNVIFRNCKDFGFTGDVFPINPHEGHVEGVTAYQSVAQLPKKPDLAIIATPASTVPGIVQACAKARVPAAIIISAGFRETGESGMKLEERVIRTAELSHITVLGPNCLGFVAPHIKLNASFAQGLPAQGSVSIVSQSGAMAVAIADWASASGIGFRYLVSLGNKAGVTESEILEYLAKDSGTKVILMYLEDVRNGRAFLRKAARITAQKPVIVIMAGRSTAAAAAVASHTGALATTGEVTVAALRSAGCIVVDTIEEWFDSARGFSAGRFPRGRRVAIVTNAGGPGILATDAIAREGLSMTLFSPQTEAVLAKRLPSTAAIHNPVDVIGDATPERYRSALQAVSADANVDAVIVICTHQLVTDSVAIAREISTAYRGSSKPIFAAFVGGEGVREALFTLRSEGIPAFTYPESAIRTLRMLREFKTFRPTDPGTLPRPHRRYVSSSGVLLGTVALDQLRRYGCTPLHGKLVRTADEAVAAARKLGFPVVMKVISDAAIHKTDMKGVVVDVHSPEATVSVAKRFIKTFGKVFKKKTEGIFIQPHILDAVEIFVGGINTPGFGPMVLVGMGGIFVEKLKGVVYAPAPLTPLTARTLLRSSSLWPIIEGTRGKTFAVASLVRTLVGISACIAAHPEVSSIDANPVMLTTDRAWLVDARMLISHTKNNARRRF